MCCISIGIAIVNDTVTVTVVVVVVVVVVDDIMFWWCYIWSPQ